MIRKETAYGVMEFTEYNVWYTYKDVRYQFSYHPFEPCLYLMNGDEYALTLHNAFTTERIIEAFAKDTTLTDLDSSVYDTEAFCKVLAYCLDNRLDNIDLFYAAKRSAGM